MIGRVLACAAAAAFFGGGAASPAHGQSRVVPAAPLISSFGACATRRWPDQARALLAAPIGSREERRVARRFAEGRSDCIQRRIAALTMHTGALRGAVAETLLESDPEAMARLRAMPSRAAVRPQEANDGRAMISAYGRCIADAEPARAARLLDVPTEARPAEHSAAVLELGDVLNDCTPLGRTLALNPIDVRDHIAMRLYDIAGGAAR